MGVCVWACVGIKRVTGMYVYADIINLSMAIVRPLRCWISLSVKMF